MEPPEWEAEPAELLTLAAPLAAGPELIIPPLPPPRALPKPPLNPPVEAAPRAMAGEGMECGAITAWGAELSRPPRSCPVEPRGAAREVGAPALLASEEGADWAKDLEFADLFARAVVCVDCLVGETKLIDGAGAAATRIPDWARGTWAPALIAPLAPCAARITVDGTAAS